LKGDKLVGKYYVEFDKHLKIWEVIYSHEACIRKSKTQKHNIS
jgi:hypothetical protein